jgi:hypothetical protein
MAKGIIGIPEGTTSERVGFHILYSYPSGRTGFDFNRFSVSKI